MHGVACVERIQQGLREVDAESGRRQGRRDEREGSSGRPLDCHSSSKEERWGWKRSGTLFLHDLVVVLTLV
ncbi:hypothetical protein H6P81_003303 [Aristolochia fimbriata]|uniref:Uncharacterized protein n=1 Tax=Aristolochia fimbriata TaxID=158543 RepID=A0AAV7FC69_ARIFI|nr:hypothetical protein H6P81_003303 [Aristolochia fimbriata]